MKLLERLQKIVEAEYHEVVAFTEIIQNKLRIHLSDYSFADVAFSLKVPGRYSYHWERRHIDGTVYRHDNFPDPRWRFVATFPKHFHNGSEAHVEESNLSEDPEVGIRQFMEFIQSKTQF